MLSKMQIKDSKRCEEMQEHGEDMDCTECSCSVCIVQENTNPDINDLSDYLIENASVAFEHQDRKLLEDTLKRYFS